MEHKIAADILYKVWFTLAKIGKYLISKIFGKNSKIYDLAYSTKIRFDNLFNQRVYVKNMQTPNSGDRMRSKLCTESDFHQDWFQNWCKKLGLKSTNLHRKLWERIAIAQALLERDMLKPGNKGLGFGVGNEPLPALFASLHCDIVATDIGNNTEQAELWRQSDQYSGTVDKLYRSNICDVSTFKKHVLYRPVDMNNLPADLTDFDFTWSSCAFEHLGSISNGIDFIINQMRCLKKGGWAVHTTEFNLTSNKDTIESKDLVLFRRKDLEKLIDVLATKGCYVEELDTSIGFTKNDFCVDKPPHKGKRHLKLLLGNYVSTSVILIIRK